MKHVMISGGTSGIGLAIARCFAQDGGYSLSLNGLEQNGNEIAAQLAQETGAVIRFFSANLLIAKEIEQMMVLVQGIGPVDILINSAGIQHVSAVENLSDEHWEAILGVNLTAAFRLTRSVWKDMKTRRFGRIINIASAHGLVASEFKSAYVASKHGLVGFTKTIALEGAPFGITANAICPGYVKTPLVEKQIADQARVHQLTEEEVVSHIMLAKHAVKEFVPVELIGQMALFLASEKASTLTGATLPIDAGWTGQ